VKVLKAIILALAVTHHPYDLNFALIDFKGGAAFNELKGLPHVVGVVTDIESNATYAERLSRLWEGRLSEENGYWKRPGMSFDSANRISMSIKS